MVTKLQLINRAIQRVGARMLDSLDDDAPQATEALALYDSVRRAELRRNIWRFAIRKNALRAISQYSTQLLTFAAWNNGTTYAVGDIATGSDGLLYQSGAASNTAHDPTATTGYWGLYFGPDVAFEFTTDWSSSVTYDKGNHSLGTDAQVYVSLVDENTNHNPVGDSNVHWSVATDVDANDSTAETTGNFYAGEILYIGRNVYLSLQSSNGDVPLTFRWLAFTTVPTLSDLNILYPLDSGPAEQLSTMNVLRIPYGFLREAPEDPLSPARPRNIRLENNYIVCGDFSPLVYRYVADVQDTTQFDALLVEGLSARFALELNERLTQDKGLMAQLASEYKQFMGDARTVNAIETGPVMPQEDDWVTVKISGAYSPYQYT